MIVNLFRRHWGLLLYTTLNYLDKAITVAVPLIILWLSKDQALYNQIEYVYSLGALLVVLLELGVRNYLLFGYRLAPDRDRFLKDGHNYFLLLNLIYVLLGVTLVVSTGLGGWTSSMMLLVVASRTLYNALFGFYSVFLRLEDRPSFVFAISIGTNLFTCGLIVGWHAAGWRLELPLVFLSQVLLVVWLAGVAIRRRLLGKMAELMRYLVKTLEYAWPIILNVFLVMAIQNFGKLYAQNALTQDDMTRISLAQRLTLLIQLGHGSAVGYLSKALFLDESKTFNRRLLLIYSLIMSLGLVLVGVAIPIARFLLGRTITIGDPVVWLFMIYNILWCYSALFELQLNKLGKNGMIPVFTVIGAFVFVVVAWRLLGFGLVGIVFGMMLGILVNMLLILFYTMKLQSGSAHV